jgi:hypothetical protein
VTRREGGAPSHSGVSRLERVSAKHPGRIAMNRSRGSPIGRRVFLGVVGLGAAGIVFGAKAQNVIGNVVGSGSGGLLSFGDRFRIYSISGTFPVIPPSPFR